MASEQIVKSIAERSAASGSNAPVGRRRSRHGLHRVISGVDRERVWQGDKHEAMRILGAARVPAGAVLDTQELHD
jgi:hypothetical protein